MTSQTKVRANGRLLEQNPAAAWHAAIAKARVTAYRAGTIAYVMWGMIHALVGLGALFPALSGELPGALATLADQAPAPASANLHPTVAGLLEPTPSTCSGAASSRRSSARGSIGATAVRDTGRTSLC